MTLKARINENAPVIAPGVYDALGAVLAAEAGFSTCYLSGASIAYTRFGRPDLGYFGVETLTDIVSSIRDRSEIDLIVDADTGFGNALNVQRTVRLLERAGASAIQLEDQSMPKRCGHLGDKRLVSAEEMVGKVKAACDARRSAETLIVARTDAVAVEGLQSGLDRAARYAEAGADILFVEALPDEAAMREATRALSGSAPVLVNVVEGGRTPILPAEAFGKMGFKIVIFPGGLVRAVARTMRLYFASLMEKGSTAAFRDNMLDFRGINEIVETERTLATGALYDPARFVHGSDVVSS